MELRAFKTSDAEPIATLLNNKKIWDNLRDFIPHPYAVEDALTFIGFCQNEAPQKTFIIEDQGQVVGVIGLIVQQDIYRKSAEIGYWIGEPYWNQGYATKAVKAMVKYGFETLDLVRIYAEVFEPNKASQGVLQKAGFRLDATLEKAIIKNNKLLNACHFSILKP